VSFPRYAKYKASGVEWLGDVPEHWAVAPLGYRYEVQLGRMLNEERATGENPRPYLRVFDVQWNCINTTDLPTMDFPPEAQVRYRLQAGDLMVNEGGSYVGRSAIWRGEIEECYYQKALHRIRPFNQSQDSSEFLLYVMEMATRLGVFVAGGNQTTIDHLTAEQLRAYRFSFPPAPEQRQTAAFLDRETSKIDALVAEQERLIALLKEKRQAVISHAVTKGLDPNAPMKDSGVEWLGDVPAHWEVTSVRRISKSVNTGGTPSNEPASEDIEGGLPWYTPGDFDGGLQLRSARKSVSLECVASGEAKIFPGGSVLIVGIGATLGKVGWIEIPSAANQQINAIVPDEKIDGRFLAYSLSVKAHFMKYLSNASTIGIMNQEKTKEIPVIVPPQREQADIVDHLASQMSRFDTLAAEAERAITLLQERRSALISAAVTGKIDVRGLDTADAEAA